MRFLLAIFTILSAAAFVHTSVVDDFCRKQEETNFWSYNSELNNGPQHWKERYPNCSGKKQSPINIATTNVQTDKSLSELELVNYDKPVTYFRIINTGRTVNISILPQEPVKRMLKIQEENYTLSYILFHWGDRYYKGSEHTVDNIQYAFEMQLVHTHGKKTGVVSVIYKSSVDDNNGFKVAVDYLKQIPFANFEYVVFASKKPIDLSKMVANKCSYYRYTGSLTTPECDEEVIWSICKNPGTIGYLQLNEFRKLSAAMNISDYASNCKLVNNFRPIQPLNGRSVFASP